MEFKNVKTYLSKKVNVIEKKMKKLKININKKHNNKRKVRNKIGERTGFKLYEVIIIMIIVFATGIVSGLYIANPYISKNNPDDQANTINEDLGQFINVYDSIMDNYYESVDKDKLIEAAIEGMMDFLGDPHSSYFDSDDKKVFDERMKGEYYGIGVELVDDVEGNIVIVNVFNGTPAKQAGVKAGDIIKGLDEVDAAEMTGSDVAVYIKEGVAQNVDLKVERAGKIIVIPITKQKITLNSITTEIFENKNQKIGYINVSIFANNTYGQFKEAVLNFEEQGVESLIIDVRNNSGGYLNAVVNMVSMFLVKDSVIYQMETNKEIVKHYDNTDDKREYPVVVLINQHSASASEILAASFKEVYNSEIIGVKSYGKGSVQETKDLKNGGMIKLTTQKWLTPNGNSIEGEGITPTIEIIMGKEYFTEPTSKNDNQLQKALELLKK